MNVRYSIERRKLIAKQAEAILRIDSMLSVRKLAKNSNVACKWFLPVINGYDRRYTKKRTGKTDDYPAAGVELQQIDNRNR